MAVSTDPERLGTRAIAIAGMCLTIAIVSRLRIRKFRGASQSFLARSGKTWWCAAFNKVRPRDAHLVEAHDLFVS